MSLTNTAPHSPGPETSPPHPDAPPTTPLGLANTTYWRFQLWAWTAITVIWYLSLTLWYNPGEFAHAAHTLVQAALGIAISHPLRWIADRTWTASMPRRAILNGAGLLIASAVWTIARMTTFTLMTQEPIAFGDWGGWINASVVVFLAWSFLYHAISYSSQSRQQRHIALIARAAATLAQETAERENVRRRQAEELFRHAQLRMLKYQLNPHFFLNALNSVSALVQKGDAANAMDMLSRIGEFLRVSLADPEELQHTLEEELDALDLYLGIEKIRFGDRLRTIRTVTGDAHNARVPCLLLQPLFENAVKFAVSARMAPTTITLDAQLLDKALHLTVRDDGPGLSTALDLTAGPGTEHERSHRAGIGLMNVRQRLESAYGDAFSFTLTNDPAGGAVAKIIIGQAQ